MIGSADDFWRIRITRVDTTDEVDFAWRDDVLYRAPSLEPTRERNLFHVEAVQIDDRDTKRLLKTFDHRDDAEAFAESARAALTEMTKSHFEDAYFIDADSTDDRLSQEAD